jgi:hypothetical protein
VFFAAAGPEHPIQATAWFPPITAEGVPCPEWLRTFLNGRGMTLSDG